MTTSSWVLVTLGWLTWGLPPQAFVKVFPLAEIGDPVLLADARFDSADSMRPTIVVQLENTTSLGLSTGDVWLHVARFFTKDEMIRNGNRIAYDCGRVTNAAVDEPAKPILPKSRVQIVLLVDSSCKLNLEHEHFFAIVERITEGRRFGSAIWTRDAVDFARLLQGAMPHQR